MKNFVKQLEIANSQLGIKLAVRNGDSKDLRKHILEVMDNLEYIAEPEMRPLMKRQLRQIYTHQTGKILVEEVESDQYITAPF